MKRKMIVFTGLNQVDMIEEPLGEPGKGQLLVKTTRTLISAGTEGTVLARKFTPGTHWDKWVKYPFRPGYSHVGRVEAVGDEVSGFSVGDRVATRERHVSHGLVGAANTVRIPEGVSDDEATWTALGKIAQAGARAAKHRMGDNVVVIGLGQVGQLVVQYARVMGAREVIGIDPAPARCEIAKAHGATTTLAMTVADALPAVKDLTQGKGAEVVYDVTGIAAVFPAALALAAKGGRVVLLGDTGNPEQQHLTGDVMSRGLKIVGAHDTHLPNDNPPNIEWNAQRAMQLFLTYVARGQMRVGDLITHRFAPAQAADAYALLQRERDKAMGVIFDWQ